MKKMHIILPNSVKISLWILCILFWSWATVFASSYEFTLWDDYVKMGSKYYVQGLIWAQTYIDAHIDDDHWIWKKPKLANYWALFYTDDDTIPAYLEYKITCWKNDCGSVMVNLDGNDVLIPEGSTSGKATFEVLSERQLKKNTTTNNKLYRLGILEQYISNNKTISAIDLLDDTDTLKLKLKKEKIREFKNSKDSFERKKNFKNNQVSTVEATAPTWTVNFPIWGSTNVFVPWSTTLDCPSRTPCYNQFTTKYNNQSCANWCAPTAWAIVMWYHDRNTKQSLVAGSVAPMINTSIANAMALNIATHMQTTCTTSQQGSTIITNIASGINYAKNNGYPSSYSLYNTNTTLLPILTNIKNEINAGRPVIVTVANSNVWHALVAYGYSNLIGSNMIRVNYGWWPNWSNKDVNISWIYINNANTIPVTWVITYVIQ